MIVNWVIAARNSHETLFGPTTLVLGKGRSRHVNYVRIDDRRRSHITRSEQRVEFLEWIARWRDRFSFKYFSIISLEMSYFTIANKLLAELVSMTHAEVDTAANLLGISSLRLIVS